MADEVVQLLLKARDEATSKVRALSNEMGALPGLVGRVTAGLGGWGAAAAGVATLGGAVLALGTKLANQVEEMDRTRAATGATLDQIQILRKAYVDSGLAAEEADRSLRKMASSISQQDPLLAKLGITTRDVFQATLQASDAMARAADPATRSGIAVGLFGKSADEAVEPLMGLSSAAASAAESLRRTGAAITEEDARKARDLDKALDDLRESWSGLSKEFTTSAAPAASGISRALTDLLSVIRDLREEQEKATREADDFTTALERQLRIAKGLPVFKGFGGGASGGRGGGGSWADDSQRPPAGPTAGEIDARQRRQFGFRGNDRLFVPPNGFGSGLDSLQQEIESWRVFNDLLSLTDEQLAKVVVGLEMTAKSAESIPVKRIGSELQVLASAADSTGLALRQAFDSWAFEGQNAANALRSAFSNAFRDIANEAFRVGIGELLGLAGTALGGPAGGFIGKVGGRLVGGNSAAPARGGASPLALAGGNTFIFHMITGRDALDQIRSVNGEFRRAGDRQRILRRAGQDD